LSPIELTSARGASPDRKEALPSPVVFSIPLILLVNPRCYDYVTYRFDRYEEVVDTLSSIVTRDDILSANKSEEKKVNVRFKRGSKYIDVVCTLHMNEVESEAWSDRYGTELSIRRTGCERFIVFRCHAMLASQD
jgi:hypothetical protein